MTEENKKEVTIEQKDKKPQAKELSQEELQGATGGDAQASQVEKRVDDARSEIRKNWSA